MRNPLDAIAARMFRRPIAEWGPRGPVMLVTVADWDRTRRLAYAPRMHHIEGNAHYNANADLFNEGVADGEAEFMDRYLHDEGFREPVIVGVDRALETFGIRAHNEANVKCCTCGCVACDPSGGKRPMTKAGRDGRA